jgi:DNA-binding LytR/AlgR family response regulator
MKIRSIIIDDEPLAQRVIEKYSEDVPFLEIVNKFQRAIDAYEILRSGAVDLIFLDINMPRLSGLDFLKSLKDPPMVIITTAYEEYAIQGFELDVVDYLMKPFAFDRFLRAIQKAADSLKGRSTQFVETGSEIPEEDYLFIKSSKRTYRVSLDDILYIEALGDYVKVYTKERMIVSYQSLKNLESVLPPRAFPRIHKSFIVSLSKIETIEGNQVRIQDRFIPVGNNYKADFDSLIHPV